MRYHHSEQIKHCDRLTVLSKLEDKYNYNDMEFPASYDDIKTFEGNHQVGVIVYVLDENNNIIKEYYGHKEYLVNERIYLLRVEDENKSYFIYIKHIQKLLNKNTHTSGVNKSMCPFCDNLIDCCDHDKHIRECYKKATTEGALIKLPPKGSFMKFQSYKNMMKRPYTFICALESKLVKNN